MLRNSVNLASTVASSDPLLNPTTVSSQREDTEEEDYIDSYRMGSWNGQSTNFDHTQKSEVKRSREGGGSLKDIIVHQRSTGEQRTPLPRQTEGNYNGNHNPNSPVLMELIIEDYLGPEPSTSSHEMIDVSDGQSDGPLFEDFCAINPDPSKPLSHNQPTPHHTKHKKE